MISLKKKNLSDRTNIEVWAKQNMWFILDKWKKLDEWIDFFKKKHCPPQQQWKARKTTDNRFKKNIWQHLARSRALLRNYVHHFQIQINICLKECKYRGLITKCKPPVIPRNKEDQIRSDRNLRSLKRIEKHGQERNSSQGSNLQLSNQ